MKNRLAIRIVDADQEDTSQPRDSRPGLPLQSVVLPLRSIPSDSRRLFLRGAVASLGGLALWLMDRLAKRTAEIPENRETTLVLPWSGAPGIRFHDRAIIVNNPDGLAVFSSLCPHLGCKINRAEGLEIVCPCHGSRFNQRGESVQGPATHALRPLPFALDRANSVLRVTLVSQQT